MRGLLPELPRNLLTAGDIVTWEAEYIGGATLREREGALYRQIDRDRLTSFKLVSPGEVLLEAFVPVGASGHNLIYRRRTVTNQDGRRVIFLIGFAPMGPAFLVDPARGTYRTEDAFLVGDPEFYPPHLSRAEGEGYLLDHLTSVT